MEQPKLTEQDIEEMVVLAQGVERSQIKRMGRSIHPTERRWVVRAAFVFRYGEALGAVEAYERADTTIRILEAH